MLSERWESAFAGLPLGGWRILDSLGSTNDEAEAWANTGASDMALVVADEQTAGRGRLGRRWFTPPGAALAFSLVLRPPLPPAAAELSRMHLAALGALAISRAIERLLDLPPQIKWPNDVLLGGRKVAGILVEAQWQGDQLSAAILGMGVNVAPASVPPPDALTFPATCLEWEAGREVDRFSLLPIILEEVFLWKARLGTPDFLEAWQDRLAFRDQWVRVLDPLGAAPPREGLLVGLDERGCLLLRNRSGAGFNLCSGELRLRPAGKD